MYELVEKSLDLLQLQPEMRAKLNCELFSQHLEFIEKRARSPLSNYDFEAIIKGLYR